MVAISIQSMRYFDYGDLVTDANRATRSPAETYIAQAIASASDLPTGSMQLAQALSGTASSMDPSMK